MWECGYASPLVCAASNMSMYITLGGEEFKCFSGTSTVQTRRGESNLNITMTLSKGVLTMEQLVLGDSVLTISRDKGLIYTEVGWFRKVKSSKSIGNVDMLSETANHVFSFLAGLIALQMQMAFSWRSLPAAHQLLSLATTSSSEHQWQTVA